MLPPQFKSSFIKVLQQNKLLSVFFKKGQSPKAGHTFCIDYGLAMFPNIYGFTKYQII